MFTCKDSSDINYKLHNKSIAFKYKQNNKNCSKTKIRTQLYVHNRCKIKNSNY